MQDLLVAAKLLVAIQQLHKAQPTFKMPKLGLGDDRRETPIVHTPQELDTKRQLMDAAMRHSYNNAHVTVMPVSQTSRGATVPKVSASFARGSALRNGSMARHPDEDIATKLHEDVHHMFSRVEQLHNSRSHRMNLARNMVMSMPKEARVAAQAFAGWKGYSPTDHEETVANIVSYLNHGGEREAFRRQKLQYWGPGQVLDRRGKMRPLIRGSRHEAKEYAATMQHDQAMKLAWKHIRDMAQSAGHESLWWRNYAV